MTAPNEPLLPCPWCRGEAKFTRMLNVDEIIVAHLNDCPIARMVMRDWHFNGEIGPVETPPKMCTAWNTRKESK